MRKSNIILLAASVVILIIVLIAFPRMRQTGENLNKPAPQFILARLDGGQVSSTELLGNVVVLDFWATWCGPCQAEFPEYQKLYDKYKDNSQVDFVAVNSSWRGDTPEKAQGFLQQNSYAFPAAYDAGGKVTEQFKVTGIPTTFVIDKKGVIRSTHVGFDGNENFIAQMSSKIDQLLAEK